MSTPSSFILHTKLPPFPNFHALLQNWTPIWLQPGLMCAAVNSRSANLRLNKSGEKGKETRTEGALSRRPREIKTNVGAWVFSYRKSWGESYRPNCTYIMYIYKIDKYVKSERCKVGGSSANGILRLSKWEPQGNLGRAKYTYNVTYV